MKVKTVVKRVVDPIGFGGVTRRAVMETGLLGERVQALFSPRPGAILLAGPGRSGTTWLADVLSCAPGTQQIFEPLLFNAEVYRLANWQSPPTQTYLRLYYLRAGGDYPGWHALLKRVLTGRYRTYLTDSVRTSYFPRRYLIKEVRANLMLGYIYDQFQPPIIYVTRHPCAVIASRLRLKWDVNLDDLLRQAELVADHLAPWVGLIERARGDVIASHAIWWAVESRVAAHDLNTRPHQFLYYEDLILNSQERVNQVFCWLKLKASPISRHKLDQHSRTTWRGSGKQPETKDRLASWQKRLSAAEQRVILDLAHRLGVMDYSDAPLPTSLK